MDQGMEKMVVRCRDEFFHAERPRPKKKAEPVWHPVPMLPEPPRSRGQLPSYPVL